MINNNKKCAILIRDVKELNLNDYDFFIGVEKGSFFLEKLNIDNKNKHFISDFDSITTKEKESLISNNKNVVVLQAEKEFVDGEEAIIYSKKLGFHNIDIYVDESGRKDHLINIIILCKKYNVNIKGKQFSAIPLQPNKEVKIYNNYKYLSIFVYDKTLLNSKGLKWDLENKTFDIDTGTTLISNEIIGEYAFIKSDKKIIIFQSND